MLRLNLIPWGCAPDPSPPGELALAPSACWLALLASRVVKVVSVGVPVRDQAPFSRACRGLPAERVPVWFMRQAGRSLPEYRAIRGEGTILDAIAKPELATEITLQPVRRYGVDAAILYSDIVVPVAAIGFGVDVAPGTGPVVEQAFRSAADLDRLRPLEPELDCPYVQETVRNVVAELGDTPLIGFAGAPFTVASYLIEGRPSRDYAATKAMLLGEPALFAALLDRLADLAIASLRAQVDAGASAVQLFDSWAGALSPDLYERTVLPASRKVFEGVADLGVPRIHFGVTTGELLGLMAAAGPEVVGVDWRVPLDAARARGSATRPCRATSTPPPCSPPGTSSPRGCATCSRATAESRGTSSTSATACCPRPIPTCSRGSSTSSTPRAAPFDAATAAVRDRRHGIRLAARAPDEVEDYYTHIRRGRPPSEDQLADLMRRYDAIGGTSPLADAHRGAARQRSRARSSTTSATTGSMSCSATSTRRRSSRTRSPMSSRAAQTAWSGWCSHRTTREAASASTTTGVGPQPLPRA